MSAAPTIADGPAFLRLMKRYVVDYTNSHDQTETVGIMEPDYELRMGDHWLQGRDGAYAEATRRQLEQFPGLGLTVHEIWTSGERLAMRFSEHGASVRHGGRLATWGGIGLYRWNGRKLTGNMVEQDYLSRKTQLASGAHNPVEPPAVAPWDGESAAPDPVVLAAAREWLETGRAGVDDSVICDDAWVNGPTPVPLRQISIEINDLFSCGPVAAFHATQHGEVAGAAGEVSAAEQPARLHMAGILHVEDRRVVRGRIIRNRLDLMRGLKHG